MNKKGILDKVALLYKDKKYTRCIEFIEPYLNTYENNYMFKTYYVNSLFHTGRQDIARKFIENVKQNSTNSVKKRNWILSITNRSIANLSIEKNLLHKCELLREDIRKTLALKNKRGINSLNEVVLLKAHYEYLKKVDTSFVSNFDISSTNGVYFFKDKKITKAKTLIVSGNARSGTTALGSAFAISDEVVMYTERFNPYLGYHPNMFQEQYIYCNGYKKLPHFKQYDDMKTKLNHAKYVGDKRPSFFNSWDITSLNYDPNDIKIVHLVRDIYSVAYSYAERAKNAEKGIDDSWSHTRGVEAACIESNLQNKILLKILKNSDFSSSIYIVNYETIFFSYEKLEKLYKLLDIQMTDKCQVKLENIVTKANQLKIKDRKLPDEELQVIKKIFDFKTYNEIIEIERKFWYDT